MATELEVNFTKAALDSIPKPAPGHRTILRDAKTPGLEVRVTSTGAKTFSHRRRVKSGALERVTIGRYPVVSIEYARDRARVISGQQAEGRSHVTVVREQTRRGMTLGDALQTYVDDDEARKLPLKPRTRLDYLNMVRPAGKPEKGRTHGPGELFPIAGKKIEALSGAILKAHFKQLNLKGATRAAYAMRVVRAVLNYHGVKIDGEPFAKATPGRDRIKLPVAKKRTRVIPSERLKDWWSAADAAVNGDYFQVLLLTGLRRGELASLRRTDVDLDGGRLHVGDTKTHRPHVVLLSAKALELVTARAANKKAGELLFGLGDPRKSLAAIISASGVAFSAHDCRRTFGSIAASLLPGYVVKRLLNHSDGNDVTSGHYVNLDDRVLRQGWQVVADFIIGVDQKPSEKPASTSNVVTLHSRRSHAGRQS